MTAETTAYQAGNMEQCNDDRYVLRDLRDLARHDKEDIGSHLANCYLLYL
jgi:hypothetical protein